MTSGRQMRQDAHTVIAMTTAKATMPSQIICMDLPSQARPPWPGPGTSTVSIRIQEVNPGPAGVASAHDRRCEHEGMHGATPGLTEARATTVTVGFRSARSSTSKTGPRHAGGGGGHLERVHDVADLLGAVPCVRACSWFCPTLHTA